MLQQGAWRPRKHSKKQHLALQHVTRASRPRAPAQVVYDFDEFMNIPPCTTGRHNADADAGGYAKSR